MALAALFDVLQVFVGGPVVVLVALKSLPAHSWTAVRYLVAAWVLSIAAANGKQLVGVVGSYKRHPDQVTVGNDKRFVKVVSFCKRHLDQLSVEDFVHWTVVHSERAVLLAEVQSAENESFRKRKAGAAVWDDCQVPDDPLTTVRRRCENYPVQSQVF